MMMVDFFDCITYSYASFLIPVGDDYMYLGAFSGKFSIHTYIHVLKHWDQIIANLHAYMYMYSPYNLRAKPLNYPFDADYNSWLGYLISISR